MADVEDFFKKWLGKSSWSFSQAVCVYCSYDPSSGVGYIGEDNTTSSCGKYKIKHKTVYWDHDNHKYSFKARVVNEVYNTETWAQVINLDEAIKEDVRAKKIKSHDKDDDGEYCFEPKEIMQWLQEKTGVEPLNEMSLNSQKGLKKRRGRRAGSGEYDDTQYLDEMDKMIKSNQAKSANEAASIIAFRQNNKPKGAREYSIKDRLARKFRERNDM